jgi:hypothetical protein
VGVADEGDALALSGESAGLLHGEEGLAAAGPAADLDAVEQADGVEDDCLVFGKGVGGILVGEGSGDDVAFAVIPCRSTRFAVGSCHFARAVDAPASKGPGRYGWA